MSACRFKGPGRNYFLPGFLIEIHPNVRRDLCRKGELQTTHVNSVHLPLTYVVIVVISFKKGNGLM